MIAIKRLLSAIDLFDEMTSSYSIACISTSRPIYLIFTETADFPAYVIREINDFHTMATCNLGMQLYELAGDLVPEPVGIYAHDDKKYDIQRGVKGAPWFQLKAKIKTAAERAHLEARIWRALTEFQAVTYDLDAARSTTLKPHTELRNAYLAYQETGEASDESLQRLVEQAVNELSIAADCPSIPQHGDFCLNNLIIDDRHITVIDFEDFSITRLPLYDHFTLALSLPSCGDNPENMVTAINHEQLRIAAHSYKIPENFIKWHYLHHLLTRLGPWSAGENRIGYRKWIKRCLTHFIEINCK